MRRFEEKRGDLRNYGFYGTYETYGTYTTYGTYETYGTYTTKATDSPARSFRAICPNADKPQPNRGEIV